MPTLDTEALLGEVVTVFDESEGWAWVQLSRDGYVGYMPSEGLAGAVTAPTHRISALRTYVYPEPDGKTPPLALLSLNALVSAAQGEGSSSPSKGGGFVVAEPRGRRLACDPTSSLWRRRSSARPIFGAAAPRSASIARGLVQLALEAAGLPCPAMPTCRRKNSAA